MKRAMARKQPTDQHTSAHALAESFARAAGVVASVVAGGSLTASLAALNEPRASLRAATQDFAYKTLRAYGVVDVLADRLTGKPVEDRVLYGLLLVALAELMARPQSAHTVVHQAVAATTLLGLGRARGLVNAVLRRYQREAATLLPEVEATDKGRYRHPAWWIERVRAEYPDDWQRILEHGNTHAPMTLRVNLRRTAVDTYMRRLDAAGIRARTLGEAAVVLERPLPVEALPGFAEGEVSVQDAGAQRTSKLLDVAPGMNVLDACAAPGGKAAHILEDADCRLTAVDISAERVRRVSQGLARLGLAADVKVGDGTRPESFAPGELFDRILIDAPCTASGVVRRHPDIKWLRRESDIASFAAMQERLLESLWRVLVPDGKLLYVTCSVFPEENRLRLDAFLARHPDARALRIEGAGQLLPSPESDGFYYAVLAKDAVPDSRRAA
jgi:16S rRNA (cytosine967-C5)-methyltransferase